VLVEIETVHRQEVLSTRRRLIMLAVALPLACFAAVSVFLGLATSCDEGSCPPDWVIAVTFFGAWIAALLFAIAAIDLIVNAGIGRRTQRIPGFWSATAGFFALATYTVAIIVYWLPR
jgi:hypothetical protein